jgi:NO-binding membrane sensor protein with MHYT domain
MVVASLVVAYYGAWCTIFLLARRTTTKGYRNILLLVLAATVMSTLGVWGMHFVGIHMAVRPADGVLWFVTFDPGYTAMSLLLTIFGSIVAFLFIDAVRFTLWRVIASGVLLGGVIGLMHFSATFKANFRATYRPLETVISIILAMAAATVALTIFFHPRLQSGKRWWRRLIASAVLSMSVAGMHYIGMAGTSFMVRVEDLTRVQTKYASHQDDLVIALPLPIISALVALLCIGIHLVDLREAKTQSEAARSVVVCSATFNHKGQLLVKEQGGLPIVVIKTPLRQAEVRAVLDSRQPTFQWLFAVSWEWDLVVDWLRGIGQKFLRIESSSRNGSKDVTNTAANRNDIYRGNLFERLGQRGRPANTLEFDDPVMTEFRDKVVDAARQLAVELDIAFQEVGVLYDRAILTGTRKRRSGAKTDAAREKVSTRLPEMDVEEGMTIHTVSTRSSMSDEQRPTPPTFWDTVLRRKPKEEEEEGEGLILFLVRKLETPTDKPGAMTASEEQYLERGFRMMDIRFLTAAFADRLEVSKQDASSMLKALQTYAKRGTVPLVQPGGVYAGLFGVRASTSRFGGLETLVYGFARHQIPAFRLPKVERITPANRRFIKRLDQITLDEAMEMCNTESLRIRQRSELVALKQGEGNNNDEDEDLAAEVQALADREQFVASLHSAFEALIASVAVYPNLAASARVSSELLQMPSRLDDSTEPAEMVIVHAVLPEETSDQIDPSQVLPAYRTQEGTPYVFTPYSLFHKAQMMLMQGKEARDFEHEVRWEMKRRYHTWGTGAAPEDPSAAKSTDATSTGANATLADAPAYGFDGAPLSKVISARRSSATPSSVAEMPPPTLGERVWSILTFGFGAGARRRAQQMPLMKSQQRPNDLPDVATLARDPSRSTPISPISPSFPKVASQLQKSGTTTPATSTPTIAPRPLTTITESPRWSTGAGANANPSVRASMGNVILPAMLSSPRVRLTSHNLGPAPRSPKRNTLTPTPPPLGPGAGNGASKAGFNLRGVSWTEDKAGSTRQQQREARAGGAGAGEETIEMVASPRSRSGSGNGNARRSGSLTHEGGAPPPAGLSTNESMLGLHSVPASPTQMNSPSAATGNPASGPSLFAAGSPFDAPTQPAAVALAPSAPGNTGVHSGNASLPAAAGAASQGQTQAQGQAQNLAPAVIPAPLRNTASLEARVRSDGWTTRHLREIERSPAGPSLLGVDY